MADKIKLSSIKLEGCGGCHMAFLDLHQQLIPLLDQIKLVYSPLNDAKDVEKTDILLVEGSVANTENRQLLKEARDKAEILIAVGSCANFGGIPGLRNLFGRQEIIDRIYKTSMGTENENVEIPSPDEVPYLERFVQAINQVVKVDYYIPGCPPISEQIQSTLEAIIKDEEPVRYTRNLCIECGRERMHLKVPRRQFLAESVYPLAPPGNEEVEFEPHLIPRRKLYSEEIYSPSELGTIDENRCFLEQGILCMGPATVEGCQARCLNGNMPCRGCFGPSPNAMEQGTKIIDALAAILPAGAVLIMDDIVGTGYRFSLPVSILPRVVEKDNENE